MNLTLHQLRTEIRANWQLLALWGGGLFLDLALNLGWIGSFGFNGNGSHAMVSSAFFLYVLLMGLLWFVFFLLPTLIVLADSPAKPDSFLDTRPMSKRDLYSAKVLFMLLLLLAPAVLQEVIHLALAGLKAGYVAQGAWDRLVLGLRFLAVGAVFACLWRNAKEWAGGLVGVLVFYIVAAITSQLVMRNLRLPPRPDSPTFVLLLWTGLIIGLGLVAALNHRYRWRLWVRCVVVDLVLAGVFLGALFCPWPNAPAHGNGPASAGSVGAASTLTVPLGGVQISCPPDDNGKGLKVSISMKPELQGLPEGYQVTWRSQEATLSGKAGEAKSPAAPSSFNAYWYQLSAAEATAMARSLGSNMLTWNMSGFWGAGSGTADAEVRLTADPAWLTEPVSIKITLAGRVRRWERLATLPLEAGASTRNDSDHWRISAADLAPNANMIYIILEHDQLHLRKSADPRLDAERRSVCVLWDEERGLVQFPSAGYLVSSGTTVGAETAFTRHAIECSFMAGGFNTRIRPLERDQQLNHGSFEHLKLVIFEEENLGEITREWTSPRFVLGDFAATRGGNNAVNDKGLSQAEFRERFNALKPPGPQADRKELGPYLNDVLRLVDSGQGSLEPWLIARLAAYIPAQLEMFIDGLSVTSGKSGALLGQAIEQGANESQEMDIIHALPRCPELAGVILHRGWVKDAQPQLFQLLETPGPLTDDAARALAWLGDPRAYPRLLEWFEDRPELDRFEMLHALPGIRSALDKSVDRIWSRPVIQNAQMSSAYAIALREGRNDALIGFYKLLKAQSAINFNDFYHLTEAVQQSFLLEGLGQGEWSSWAALEKWVLSHQPEDFRFDPVRRKFVLNGDR